MSDKKSNSETFNQSIQKRLHDDQWDNQIVQKIMDARRGNNRKRIQFAIIPVILLTTTSVFYMTGEFDNKSQKIAKNVNKQILSPVPGKRTTVDPKNNDFKIHLIDVVFNKLQ